ncbi:MAG TPA: class I SAM-dependent methyltransferase [Ignavibacteriaceae bacterium]
MSNNTYSQLNNKLTPEQETLFLTLYGKAIDFRAKKSILNDKFAQDIIERVGIDLSKFADSNNRIVAVRAKQFDDWANDFISKNKYSTILNLGCGLDTRYSRIKPPAFIQWFDLDFPDVIELRKSFFDENQQYKMIAQSVTAKDWIFQIPKDTPILIIAEGLFSYLSEDEVKTLLNTLTDYFKRGEILFNIVSPASVKKTKNNITNKTGAVQKWLLDDVSAVDALDEKLNRIKVLPLFKSKYIKKLPFKFSLLLKLANLDSKYKNMIQLLHYEFGR